MREQRLQRAVQSYHRYSGRILDASIGVCLFYMMSVITVDVIGRYFGSSILIADEMSRYMLIAIVYLGLATTQRAGKHIDIDLVTSRLSPASRRRLATVVLAISIVVLAWLTIITAEQVRVFFLGGVVSRTLAAVPLWIPYLCIPVGMGTLTVDLVFEFLLRLGTPETLEERSAKGLLAGRTTIE